MIDFRHLKETENKIQEMKNTIKEICKKYSLYQD